MEKGSFYDRLFKVCICNKHFSQTRVFLHLKNKHPPLLWQQRSRILKDVCRGMAWLHATVPPIIHGDIKMLVKFIIAGMCIYACVYHHRTNVLLDHHLTAKLGDFGFSQEFAQVVGGRSFITAAVVAKSLGYSAPEMDTCKVSPKSDVYSYGMVKMLAVRIFTFTYV